MNFLLSINLLRTRYNICTFSTLASPLASMSICPTIEIRFDHASGALVLSQCFDWLNVSYDSPTTVPRQSSMANQNQLFYVYYFLFYPSFRIRTEVKIRRAEGPSCYLVLVFSTSYYKQYINSLFSVNSHQAYMPILWILSIYRALPTPTFSLLQSEVFTLQSVVSSVLQLQQSGVREREAQFADSESTRLDSVFQLSKISEFLVSKGSIVSIIK